MDYFECAESVKDMVRDETGVGGLGGESQVGTCAERVFLGGVL